MRDELLSIIEKTAVSVLMSWPFFWAKKKLMLQMNFLSLSKRVLYADIIL